MSPRRRSRAVVTHGSKDQRPIRCPPLHRQTLFARRHASIVTLKIFSVAVSAALTDSSSQTAASFSRRLLQLPPAR